MRARYHFIVTALLCIPFLYYGDWWGALLCMGAGFLVDVDHEIDYYIYNGKFTLSITTLSEKVETRKHYYCPLHSWELVLLLLIIAQKYPPLYGAGLGLYIHLILDMIGNNMYGFSFFLLYRGLNNFRQVDVYGRNNPN